MTLSSALPCVLSRTIGSIVGSSLSWGCIYVPTPHRGAFCPFLFWWIYYCHSSKYTGKKTDKTHLCAPHHFCDIFVKLSIPHSFRSWNFAYICDSMKKSNATLHGFWPHCGENEGRLGRRGKGNAIAQVGKIISEGEFQGLLSQVGQFHDPGERAIT